ncbi:MFS transporter, partial [Streptococcus anginosus]|nr:MFS transporter [Streptococcus anginosus]
ATGGAWGSVALALAHDHASASLLQGQAATAETVRIIVLLAALPLGALVGALPLDLVSHALGRRPATLVCATLAMVGAVVGAVSAAVASTWGQSVGALVTGLG